MSRLPDNYSLVAHFDELRSDIAFIRALRRLRVILPSGETVPAFAPGAINATLDFRGLSASGATEARTLPAPAGQAGAYLVTDGATSSWQPLHAETVTWLRRVSLAGGSLAADSVSIADALARALAAASYGSKIVYLLPFLGTNIHAALIPLRDSLAVGAPANTGFSSSSFSQSTGLQGDGATKILDLRLKPSQLGAANNGGLGYWENAINFSGSGVEPMGCYGIDALNQLRYVLDLRASLRRFCWGQSANHAIQNSAATNGHYYAQRSSSTARELFFGGSSIGSDTTSDPAAGAGDRNLRLMGSDEGASILYWAGRCAVSYLTDGTLSAGEAAAFHTLLQTHLITPTGR